MRRAFVTALAVVFLGAVSASFAYGLLLLSRRSEPPLSPPDLGPGAMGGMGLRLREARQRLQRGEVEQAILAYRNVLARAPLLEAQLGLAEGERRAGREEVAAAEYERALRMEPRNAAALRWLAGYYARRRPTWDLAVARCRDLLEVDPEDADSRLLLARLLVWRGKGVEAAAVFARPEVQSRMTTEDVRDRGFALARAGHDGEAEKALASVLAAQPADEAVARQLAGLRARRGDWAGADALYRPLVRAHPGDAELLLAFGTGLELTGRCGEALGPLDAAARAQPRRVEASLALARALRDCGRPRDAARELERAQKSARDDSRLIRDYADVLVIMGKRGKAVGQYRRALALGPREPGLLAALARALAADGKPRDALPYLEEACARSHDPGLRGELSGLYARLGLPGPGAATPVAEARR